jgi:hypothetical protein
MKKIIVAIIELWALVHFIGCTPGTIWPHVHVDVEKHQTTESDSLKAIKMIK